MATIAITFAAQLFFDSGERITKKLRTHCSHASAFPLQIRKRCWSWFILLHRAVTDCQSCQSWTGASTKRRHDDENMPMQCVFSNTADSEPLHMVRLKSGDMKMCTTFSFREGREP